MSIRPVTKGRGAIVHTDRGPSKTPTVGWTDDIRISYDLLTHYNFPFPIFESRQLISKDTVSLCQVPLPTMGFSNAAAVGNAGLVLLLVLTILISACMLYQLPSPEYFDDDWIRHGFCVSNADTTWFNSHSLSFYADVVLALCIARLFANQPKSAPPLQAAMLSGAIFGVFGHGLGHLYLGTNVQRMDLRFRPEDIPTSVASILVTVMAFWAIFQGTMPLSSRSRLAMTAVVATAGFTILDIAPKLNFVYAQAAIYISNSLHMLTLSSQDKSAATYALYPYFQLPVLLVGVLESTACQGFLQPLGGHVLFDSAIGIVTIGIELLSRYLESDRPSATKSKRL